MNADVKRIQGYLLLIITCIYSTFACKENTSVSALLEQSERLVEQYPDSALAILQKIDHSQKLSARQHAQWCLLSTQAKDKAYVTHTSDSIIKIAVAYFEKTTDKHALMKSYYYAATVNQDLGDAPQAQYFYLKALDLYKETNDHAFGGRIYGNLGMIYTFQYLYDVALDLQRKSEECFRLVGDTTNLGASLRDIGRIYSVTDQLDSSLFYYNEALLYLTDHNSIHIYNEIAGVYELTGNYEKAFDYIQLALSSPNYLNDTVIIYFSLGKYYRHTHQYDSAVYYYTKCINSPNLYSKAGAYLGLAQIEEAQRNWEKYIPYNNTYQELKDSIDKITVSENLMQIQSMYNYQCIEEERAFHEQTSNRRIIFIYRLIVGFIATVVLFMLLLSYFLHSKRNERQKNEAILRIEQQKYMQSRQSIEDRENKIRELEKILAERGETNVLHKKPEDFYASRLYFKIIDEQQKMEDSDWDELETWIDILDPDFTQRLKYLLPLIKDDELKLCYLKKVKTQNKRIADILCITASSVSKKWERLYSKFTHKKGSTSDMDIFMEGL